MEARRQKILDAAAMVFSRRGIQGATMVEIAQEAGLTPGALYRYFPSKDRLADTCYGVNAAALEHQWDSPLSPGVNALEDFAALAELTFSMLDEAGCVADTALYAEHILDLHREGDEPGMAQLREAHDRIIAGVRARLTAARDAGQIAPSLDPAALADALTSFYWGLRMEKLYRPTLDWRGQFEQVMLLLRQSARWNENSNKKPS
jgi:AcrR family transcriptional regulator